MRRGVRFWGAGERYLGSQLRNLAGRYTLLSFRVRIIYNAVATGIGQ